MKMFAKILGQLPWLLTVLLLAALVPANTRAANATMEVSANGPGSFSPNYNGMSLQVGRGYSITAIPAAGFAFSNWASVVISTEMPPHIQNQARRMDETLTTVFSSLINPTIQTIGVTIGAPVTNLVVLTNQPTLSFAMSQGLQMQATFVDIAPPAVTITVPTPSLAASNTVYTAIGTARDNVGTTNIFCQFNGNGWQTAYTTNGWTNWFLPGLPLLGGTNIVQAYAVDVNGNVSPTNTARFLYVSKSILTVTNIGNGTETPNDNGVALQVGQNFTITAVPGAGFVFSNWFIPASQNFDRFPVVTPPIYLTNRPTLTFAMSTGLVLRATFLDTQKPTVTITSPVANQTISSNNFTIRGTASDNGTVASVMYRFNGGDWQTATGSNNWSAGVNLTPGTNIVQAFAVDTTGNSSPTNTTRFIYGLKEILTVDTFGKGTVTPNDNGVLLQVGQNYSLTATPATGFAFSNWSSFTFTVTLPTLPPGVPLNADLFSTLTNITVLTNRPTLTFNMPTELNLLATFMDVAPPTVTITSPVANQTISSNNFSVRGTASDNGGVARVRYQLNGGGWQTATGTTNWSGPVNLTAGTNIIQAFAVDTAGNSSPTNTTRFIFALKEILTVDTFGKGTVSPNDNGVLLQVGQNYSLTATPATGFAFSNWSSFTFTVTLPTLPPGVPLNADLFSTLTNITVLTNRPTLTFNMPTELNLLATFMDVAPPTVTIISPTATLAASNTTFTITGSARDNGTVAQVFCQLNGTGWQRATSNNGWTNWSLTNQSPVPGTNVIQAYAVDSGGNISTTNTARFLYVATAGLTVTFSGQGTLTPNYNRALLQIGQNYSMTARAATGFQFANWSSLQIITNRANPSARIEPLDVISTEPGPGSAYMTNVTYLTNSATLVFTMSPGLNLQPTFADIAPPVVRITSPTAGMRVSNSVYTVTGTVTDNVAVAVQGLHVQANGGVWQGLWLPDGATTWSISGLPLLANATNILRYYAVDTSGNISPTNTLAFVNVYTEPAPASLAGLQATILPTGGTTSDQVTVGFSQNTFSQVPYDVTQSPSVGTYSYTKTDATDGILYYTNTAPPTPDGSPAMVEFTFTSPFAGTYFNPFNDDNGTFTLLRVSNVAPASVTGKKAVLFNSGGKPSLITFGNGTLTFTNGEGRSEMDAYNYQADSSLVSLVGVGDPEQGTNYVIFTYTTTNSGRYYSSDYDAGGNLQNSDMGEFVFPSATPTAPATLAGITAVIYYSDGTYGQISFGNSTYSQQSDNPNQTPDMGTYHAVKNNATNITVTLTPTVPSGNTDAGGTAVLTFLSPAFCYFTTPDNAPGTVNVGTLLTLPAVAPASLAGKTVYATNLPTIYNPSAAVETVSLSANGTFTQVESNSDSPGTSGGSYTYNVYSAAGAVLRLTYTSGVLAGATTYVQADFVTSGSGSFARSYYESPGSQPQTGTGIFSIH